LSVIARRVRHSAIPLACALCISPGADVTSLVQPSGAPASTASSDLGPYLGHNQVDTLAIAHFAGAANPLREGKMRESQSSFQSVALIAPALADWAHLLSADAAARLGGGVADSGTIYGTHVGMRAIL
jgi:hypothetical protein